MNECACLASSLGTHSTIRAYEERYLQEKIALDELRIELKYLKEKQELDIIDQANKHKAEQYALSTKLKKAEETVRLFKDICDKVQKTESQYRDKLTTLCPVDHDRAEREEHSERVDKETDQSPLEAKSSIVEMETAPQLEDMIHQSSEQTHSAQQASITLPNRLDAYTEAVIQAYNQLRLPLPEVKRFSGDPMEYNEFIRSFKSRIVPYTSFQQDLLYYLDQCLDGETKLLIKGF